MTLTEQLEAAEIGSVAMSGCDAAVRDYNEMWYVDGDYYNAADLIDHFITITYIIPASALAQFAVEAEHEAD